MDERFKSVENKLQLLDFLITELQAARMIVSNKPNLVIEINTQQQSVRGSNYQDVIANYFSLKLDLF